MRCVLVFLLLAAPGASGVAQVRVSVPGSSRPQDGAWLAATVRQIRVVVRTGQDDLRGNSYFEPILELHDGRRLLKERISCTRGRDRWYCPQIANDQQVSYVWELADPLPKVGDITRVGIRFHSVKPSPFDTPDNWDLQMLEMRATARMPDGRLETRVLYAGRGNPLYRFKNSGEWESPGLRR